MPTIFSSSPLVRAFCLAQSSLRTLPNSTGTPTMTGNKMFPFTRFVLTPGNEIIEDDSKTGTGSMTVGRAGRKGPGMIDLELPFRPSGAAGTAPDIDAILAGCFGATATLVSSTSATYNQSDAISPFALYLFDRSSSSATQFAAWGCVPSEFSLNIGGGGYFKLGLKIPCGYILDSNNFANEDTVAKAGYTSFPSEPSNPTIAGANINPFGGSITIGGTSTTEFRSAQLVSTTGKSLVGGGFADGYPDGAVQGRRRVTLRSLAFAKTDSAAAIALTNAALNKTAQDVVITLNGGGAGYIATITLKSVQFGNPVINDDGPNVTIQIPEAAAHASAVGNTNDLVIALT